MNNDIKEIKISKSTHSIVIMQNGVTVKEQFAIDDEILDYITNLQEENKQLKERNENQKNMLLKKSYINLKNIELSNKIGELTRKCKELEERINILKGSEK